MKTLQPLILTARIRDDDLAPFDLLRQSHFPRERNFLRAHLTMFHWLPGECSGDIVDHLQQLATAESVFEAEVDGLRHLGAGVAFTIASPQLQSIHARLKRSFAAWLGGQDMQKWQPHITVQNKVSKSAADALHETLSAEFQPHPITIVGLDLWRYLDGPWQHDSFVEFKDRP